METHADRAFCEALAAEVRGEMAAQKRTANELAQAIGTSAHTAGRRLAGDQPFNVIEMALAASWLGVRPDLLVARAEHRAESQTSTKKTAA